MPGAKPGEAFGTIGNLAGKGLLTTGQSGLFRALESAGNLASQAWNAVLSALGAAQHVRAGNANKASAMLTREKRLVVELTLAERKRRELRLIAVGIGIGVERESA